MRGRGVKLMNLMGFEVRLHSSWLILGLLVAFSLANGFFPADFPGYSKPAYWVMALGGVAGLLFSIVIHEFAHSVVARRYGIPMRGITLFIFGGVAEMGDEPPNAKSEFLMAIAGPLTSFVISALAFATAPVVSSLGLPAFAAVFSYLAVINLALGLFNLIPAFPLDGGRVLRSALWAKSGDVVKATRIAAWLGSAFGVLLILFGFWNIFRGNVVSGIWGIMLGLFVRNASRQSYRLVLYRRAIEQRRFEEMTLAHHNEPQTIL